VTFTYFYCSGNHHIPKFCVSCWHRSKSDTSISVTLELDGRFL